MNFLVFLDTAFVLTRSVGESNGDLDFLGLIDGRSTIKYTVHGRLKNVWAMVY